MNSEARLREVELLRKAITLKKVKGWKNEDPNLTDDEIKDLLQNGNFEDSPEQVAKTRQSIEDTLVSLEKVKQKQQEAKAKETERLSSLSANTATPYQRRTPDWLVSASRVGPRSGKLPTLKGE